MNPDFSSDRDVRNGRHRARHEGAAPDPYAGGDNFGYAYGDGRSPDPLYATAPEPVEAPVIIAAAPPKKSRAGRNLPAAIAVGLLLAGIVLGSLFLWTPAFIAVLAVAAGVGVWEMVQAVGVADKETGYTGSFY